MPTELKADLRKGDEIPLEILDAAFEGKSVARHQGIVVFVDGGVPGDWVTARVVKVKKNFAEARTLRVDKPSGLRVTPPCKHFSVCGGCKWQHVDYSAQLRFKQQHVVDAFERIGGFKNVTTLPILGSEAQYFYRNKMEYSFSDQQWLETPPPRKAENDLAPDPANPPGVYLGLHVPQRYDKVLEIEECHLQSRLSNEILNFTRAYARKNNLPVYSSELHSGYLRFLVIRQSRRSEETLVNLVTFEDRQDTMRRFSDALVAAIPSVTTVVNTVNTRKAQIAYGELERVYVGNGVIRETLGGATFKVSAASFFQTNTAQAERLYAVAKSFGEFNPTDVVYDLYCGTGAIAIFIADAVQTVVAVDSAESAIRDAGENAVANGVKNCEFVLGDLKDRLTRETDWVESHPPPNAMIIDPPRSGMHPRVVEEIVRIGPERIVYVSCNPATQARDAKLLCASGYSLEKLQPVDMFPHTYHVENVALFRRSKIDLNVRPT